MQKNRFGMLTLGCLALSASLLGAQQTGAMPEGHVHTPGMTHQQASTASVALPRQAGQSAYAAIAEISLLLQRDPTTDWSTVDLEALRGHLIDMDEVTLRSAVTTRQIPGGIEVDVTGTGRTSDAIRRMTRSHATTLEGASPYRMTVTDIQGGVRAQIVAAPSAPATTATRIRGLGFIGVMTDGDHHAVHHLALARGASVPGHEH